MERQGSPGEVVEAIRDSADCNLYFFGDKVPLSATYCVLIASLTPTGISHGEAMFYTRSFR